MREKMIRSDILFHLDLLIILKGLYFIKIYEFSDRKNFSYYGKENIDMYVIETWIEKKKKKPL